MHPPAAPKRVVQTLSLAYIEGDKALCAKCPEYQQLRVMQRAGLPQGAPEAYSVIAQTTLAKVQLPEYRDILASFLAPAIEALRKERWSDNQINAGLTVAIHAI